jgi:hypothetical protein
VLYDRLLQHGRFAERPVASGGAAPVAKAASHGKPVFRRHQPTWTDAGTFRHGDDTATGDDTET